VFGEDGDPDRHLHGFTFGTSLERAAASVVPVGAGVRVTPRAGASGLDALESALAPLLPTSVV